MVVIKDWWVEQHKADMADRDDVGVFDVLAVACPMRLLASRNN